MMMDGRWMMMMMMEDRKVSKNEKHVFKGCRGCSGEHPGGVRMALQKFDRKEIYEKQFFVTRWYGSHSIRNALISVSRPHINRNIKKSLMIPLVLLRTPNPGLKGSFKNIKIVINGSPRGRFEHLGVETA